MHSFEYQCPALSRQVLQNYYLPLLHFAMIGYGQVIQIASRREHPPKVSERVLQQCHFPVLGEEFEIFRVVHEDKYDHFAHLVCTSLSAWGEMLGSITLLTVIRALHCVVLVQ